MKFRTDVSGFITGIRFYKSAGNTGTHVGKLSATAPARCSATATFTNETASGWQQVDFAARSPSRRTRPTSPRITRTDGHYSANSGYFATAGVDAPPLHALPNGDRRPERRLRVRRGRVPDLKLQRHQLLGRRHLLHVRRRRRHDAALGHGGDAGVGRDRCRLRGGPDHHVQRADCPATIPTSTIELRNGANALVAGR